MTASFALGIAATQRNLATPGWPRFATQQLHRNVALLSAVALVAHVITTIVDSYVNVGWLSLLVPGTSHYRTMSVGVGTVAFDLIVLVIVTSLLKDRLSPRVWRWLHRTVYLAWPLSFLHFINTGTDAAHHRWGLWLAVGSLIVVVAAVIARLAARNLPAGPLRSMTAGIR